MLHVHLSNRYEVLAARLLTTLAQPVNTLAALMRPHRVLVPSLAVRRALTLDIARATGVCAQVAFGFLAPWLWQQMRGGSAAQPTAEKPLAAGPLAWRIWQVFGDAEFAASHPRLVAQLLGGDPLQVFELATRTAELFEQYGTYRADALCAWAAGRPWPGVAGHPDHAWQADLWQRLALPWQVPQLPPPGGPAGVDEEAHVFCPLAMPPLHLQWLQALAQQRRVHLYLLNPCREHWLDIVDTRRLAQLQAHGQATGAEVGNPLLARWAKPAQTLLQSALATEAGSLAADEAPYLPSPAPTVLAELQNAVLELRPPDAATLAARAADTADCSLQVHGCHSLLRQLEALQAHLLRLFAQAEAAGSPLAPGRVLVALPNLDDAAPTIDAVFGAGVAPAPAARERSLPYLITGRAPSRSPGPARALLALLELAGSRWRASEVWAVLQMPLVARRFGLLAGGDDAMLQLAHDLLQASGVRWGRDAQHRARLDLPADPRQTWADALARLLLGHALPTARTDDGPHGVTAPVFAGIVPAGAAEGAAALALGSLCAFVQALGELQDACRQPLPPDAWLPLLHTLPGRFLQPADDDAGTADDEALQALLAAIGNLGANWQQAELSQALPLAVVRSALQQELDAAAPGGLPGGAITFAAMASLRGLPYEHICVLGLDDGVWPGRSTPLEFDLMAAAPRAGDRQRRIDERNVFLDLLLSARRSLFLAYTAHSQRDNAPLTPSVLLSELLDLLPPSVRRQVVVEHPLQPFDPRLFAPDADPRLRSPDAAMAAALRDALAHAALDGGKVTRPSPGLPAAFEDEDDAASDAGDAGDAGDPHPPFFYGPLSPAVLPRGPRVLLLADLRRFFRHPARWLLQQRLGLRMLQAEAALADDEAFLPDRAARRTLAAELLPALVASPASSQALAQALQRARAGTAWPAGAIGEATLQAEVEAVYRHAERVQAALDGNVQPPLAVTAALELDDAPCALQAQIEDLRPQGLVLWRHAPIGGPALLDAWLQHLMLCLGLQQAQAAGQARAVDARTLWLAEDGQAEFAPVARPAELLQALLDLYARGQRQPLHFYPRTSWEQAQPDSTPGKVRNIWTGREGSTRTWAESRDPWNRLALRGVADPLDVQFEMQSQAIYQPLLEHLEQTSATPEGSDEPA